jgi:hypothetical protein
MTLFLTILAVLAALVLVFWIGLRVKPRPFDPLTLAPAAPPEIVPLPAGLPAPVDRFYRQVYGDQIPVIHSAVIGGRVELRVNGIPMHGRFRFSHEAGQNYRHYIETTWFGLPLMKVNETYLDGKTRFELPFGVTEDHPKARQAANLGLWSETLWFPAVFLTDPRVRWEPLDDDTAVLVVPFEDQEEHYVVRFDSRSGMVTYFEAMRYRETTSESKTLWINEARGWGELDGKPMLLGGAAIWMDEGTPWAVFMVEELVLNADLSQYVRAKGP